MGWVEESTERAPNLDGGLTAGWTKDVKRAWHDPTKLSADAQGHGKSWWTVRVRLGRQVVTLPVLRVWSGA